MPAFIDLTGQKFTRLTPVRFTESKTWLCRCECGAETHVSSARLNNGNTKSCGCYQKSLVSARSMTHGKRGTPEYAAWTDINSRCTNPNVRNFASYGGRGITVFDGWRGPEGFSNFFNHVGPRPSAAHSLDRINNAGNYEPGNVRWATAAEQARNRQDTLFFVVNGTRMFGRDVAKSNGISASSFYGRISKGWTVAQAATEPVANYSKRRSKEPK